MARSKDNGQNLGAEWGRNGASWVRQKFGHILGIDDKDVEPWAAEESDSRADE